MSTWGGSEARRLGVLVRAEFGYLCHLCGLEIEEGDYSVDHVVPRSKGGSNSLENLRPAHQLCNSTRRDRPIEEFRSLNSNQMGWFFNLAPA